MNTRLSIGDFSRMTYLSIKALRRYHEMGLLVPAAVDQFSGFRYYEPAQVPVGQVIRRFRDLGMPLDQVKEVLRAPDAATRNEVIVAHLRHMEKALEQTQQTVASLRSLLEQPHQAPIRVEYRSVPDTHVLAISEPVAMSDVGEWWGVVFAELHRALKFAGAPRIGPDGALYSSEFFESELGEVMAFIPVGNVSAPSGRVISAPSGRVRPTVLPGAELAITVHQGAFCELDRAYGALGMFVAEREIGVQGPIREHYIVSFAETGDESQHRTEVCWPVFRTRADEPAVITGNE